MRSRCLVFLSACVLLSCSDHQTPTLPSTAAPIASPTTSSPQNSTPVGGGDSLTVLSLVGRSSLIWSVGVVPREHSTHAGDDGGFALGEGRYSVNAPNVDEIGIEIRLLDGEALFDAESCYDGCQISSRTTTRTFSVLSATAEFRVCPNDNDDFAIERQQ